MQRLSSLRRKTARGAVGELLGEDQLIVALEALGEAGSTARALDMAVVDAMAGMAGLSSLSSAVAVGYVERVGRALGALGAATGVYLTTRGYAAHLVVEAAPGAYGAVDVPVLSTLPPARDGHAPRDLTTRLVRASRRGFEHIRAVDADVWEGFVALTTWRVHDAASGGEPVAAASASATGLDPAVVDGLVRFGWLLRQADIHYGLSPELS